MMVHIFYFIVKRKLPMKNLFTARCMDIPYNSTTDNDFDPVTIFCPDGKFNDLATLFLVRQEDAIR